MRASLGIKSLKPDVLATDASGTLASRFVREARATIKIRSEHVPRQEPAGRYAVVYRWAATRCSRTKKARQPACCAA